MGFAYERIDSTVKELFLIRHGRQGSKLCNVDVSLDDVGRRQAALLAERLAGYGIERLYSSALKRALETAQIVGDRLEVVPEVVQDLHEIDFGTMTGKEDSVIAKEYAQFREERAQQTSDLPYPGGESGKDVVARVMPRVEEICRRPETRVALVVHGGVIRAVCAHILETDLKNKLKFSIDLENTSITQITYEEKRELYYLERLNDFAHLETHPELLRNNWKPSLIRS